MPAKRELTMRQMRQMLRLAPRRGERPRDRAHAGGGAQHGPGQPQAGRSRRAGVAAAGRADRRRARAAAVRPRRGRGLASAGASEPDWAALARELKRPGVNLMVLWEEYRDGSPGWLRLLAVLRSVPGVRAAPVAGDAPASRRRRQGVRRLLGQEDRDRRSRRPARCARPRSSSPCSAPRTTPTPRRPGPRRCRTGSGRTSACSASSAACRAWSCPTI